MRRMTMAAFAALLAIGATGPVRADDADATDMQLQGDADGTVFGTLTITGEDRISIEFERPELSLDLDPREAPGLEWGDPLAILQRSGIDLAAPFLATTAQVPSRGLADEWAAVFRDGPVARFQPNLEDVEEWALTIVDSQSDTVAVFDGRGDVPEEIAWNGLRTDGRPAQPGRTYSYVLEAADRAGNRRAFPGTGFEVPPYRVVVENRMSHLFAGRSLPTGWSQRPGDTPPVLLVELASRLNRDRADTPIEVRVGARTFSEASTLGDAVSVALRDRLLGDPARVRVVTDVRNDAPEGGTVEVVALPVDERS